MKKENSISRRSFLKSSALAGALGAIGTGSTVGVLTSCGGGEKCERNKAFERTRYLLRARITRSGN